jgi:dynein heavy chain
MQNPDNQVGWTDLVTKDLMERFNNFVAQNYVMIGLSKGQNSFAIAKQKNPEQ